MLHDVEICAFVVVVLVGVALTLGTIDLFCLALRQLRRKQEGYLGELYSELPSHRKARR